MAGESDPVVTTALLSFGPCQGNAVLKHSTFFSPIRPSKKISCLSSEIFDEIRAGGRIFIFFFIYSVQLWAVWANPAARCVITVGVAVVGDGQFCHYWVCSLHVAYID